MDKSALVGIDIDEGRKFLELLSDSGITVSAALWQYSELWGNWDFVIVTALVDERGVRGAYDSLDRILTETVPPIGIDLLHVSLFTPQSAFYRSLKSGFRGARNKSVVKQPVGDHVLDEGYIYFVK